MKRIERNRIIIEGKTPKIVFNEESQIQGGVCIEEGIELAKQYARKIIEMKGLTQITYQISHRNQ